MIFSQISASWSAAAGMERIIRDMRAVNDWLRTSIYPYIKLKLYSLRFNAIVIYLMRV